MPFYDDLVDLEAVRREQIERYEALAAEYPCLVAWREANQVTRSPNTRFDICLFDGDMSRVVVTTRVEVVVVERDDGDIEQVGPEGHTCRRQGLAGALRVWLLTETDVQDVIERQAGNEYLYGFCVDGVKHLVVEVVTWSRTDPFTGLERLGMEPNRQYIFYPNVDVD